MSTAFKRTLSLTPSRIIENNSGLMLADNCWISKHPENVRFHSYNHWKLLVIVKTSLLTWCISTLSSKLCAFRSLISRHQHLFLGSRNQIGGKFLLENYVTSEHGGIFLHVQSVLPETRQPFEFYWFTSKTHLTPRNTLCTYRLKSETPIPDPRSAKKMS